MKSFILITLVLLCGCASRGLENYPTPRSVCPKDEERMVYVKPKSSNYKEPWSNEGMNIPNWINDPTIGGKYLAASGSCFKDGLSYSEYRNKAYESAVTEIGRSKSVKVKSVFKNYETGDGVSYVEDVSKLESTQHVTSAHIVSTWEHPARREYYVWVVVE
jgi:hypothetical protein